MRLTDSFAVLRDAGIGGTRRLLANSKAMKRLVRPFAVTSCLMALEKNGLNQRLLDPTGIDIDAEPTLDSHTLTTILEYLFENDLLTREGKCYRAKNERRYSYALEAMYAVLAYHEPAEEMDRLLRGEARYGRDLVRDDEYDAIASATLTSKFSYHYSRRVLDKANAGSLMDMGCGTGEFLAYLSTAGFSGRLYGVDLAEDAVEAGRRRGFQRNNVELFTGDLLALHESAQAHGVDEVDVLSLMFVLHEFDDATVPRILRSAADTFPRTRILLTELLERDSETLRRTRGTSVFPELKLVHRLSNQVLRTAAGWDEVFSSCGYTPAIRRVNARTNHLAVLYERA